MANKYKVFIEQLEFDMENLELRVSTPDAPNRYAPLGGHIMERLYYLRNNYPDSKFIQDYEILYETWGKINTILTNTAGRVEIDNDKLIDI
jgi:hypothetical protein